MEGTGSGQIGVNDLLLARGVGGGYGGGFGGGFGMNGMGMGTHGANGAYGTGANAIRIDSHASAHAAGLENLLDQNQFATTNGNIVEGFNRAADSRASNVGRVADNQFRSELRQSDQAAAMLATLNANARVADKCCCDVQKAIADAAKDAAKCCCDAKLEACKNTGDLMAAILSENGKTRELMQATALDAANAKVVQLETINALSRGHHG
jgi:hypothetical protein